MKILLTILLITLSTNAQAAVKRGEFNSHGYIMDYQKNDYKGYPTGYDGYNLYKYDPYKYTRDGM